MAKTSIVVEPYDSAEHLKTPEALAAYLSDILEDNDPALIAHALGVAARAHGMTDIAKKTRLSRESLYRSLSADGNPELETMVKVLSELGLRLTIVEAGARMPRRAVFAERVAVGQRYTVANPSGEWRTHEPKRSATMVEKSVSASRLTQKTQNEVTSKKIASAAAKILRDPKASKPSKSAAASALTQKTKKKK